MGKFQNKGVVLMKPIVFIEQAQSKGDDRAIALQMDNTNIFLLADGAGGFSGGSEAAEYFVSFWGSYLKKHSDISDPLVLEKIMRNLDHEMALDFSCGETTGIVAFVREKIVFGASVGDSQSWLFNSEFKQELTFLQHRKPLLGSGDSIPVSFGPYKLDGTLLVGSDGLFNYTSLANIENILNQEWENIPQLLVDLVRLRSGQLQDDISFILHSE